MSLAPICLFTYNRLEETRISIDALQDNYLAKESELFIFSDGWKSEFDRDKIELVRAFLKTITGFKKVTIFEANDNKGLANSIIDGVTQVIKTYGKVIVLEDDLITTPNFLCFMNESLMFYSKSLKIQSINGYSLKVDSDEEVYFHNRTFSWGWATWGNNWSKDIFDAEIIKKIIKNKNSVLSDFNKYCGEDMSVMLQDSLSGINNSWYVKWAFDHFINDHYAVYPTSSKINNLGFNGTATHCLGINTYVSNLDSRFNCNFRFENFEKAKINQEFLKYFTKKYKVIYRLKLLISNPIMLPKLIIEIKDRIILRISVLPRRLKRNIK